jgi:hypothetical protein
MGEIKDKIAYHKMFRKELLKRSMSVDFKEAKKEWEYIDCYKVEKADECICTKKICNIFLIEHKKTKELLKIGSECYKHIDKARAEKAKRELMTKLDMKKNPDKYCFKCNTKKKKQYKNDIYLCKCQKLEYELEEIKRYGRNNNFRFGKYKGIPFMKQAKNYSYINWLSNLNNPNVNVSRFLDYVKKLNSLETEKKNIKGITL